MNSNPSILVIDDDPALRKVLEIGLSGRGYRVRLVGEGHLGVMSVIDSPPDAVILDLGLPDQDGVEVCSTIRSFSDVPIIVLSAVHDELKKVAALDNGADDYVTKPFGMAELAARLRVSLRHRQIRGNFDDAFSSIEIGNILIDFAASQVQVKGVEIDLTQKEFALLSALARNVGRIYTHRQLLNDVWGEGYFDEINYLRVYVNRLRQKLGQDGSLIRTRAGIGYQMVESDGDSNGIN
ncbi:response regulator transcription factor [Acidithrix ferrooxidans]|uniref:KDP operon transcriptional regulatory protein KdpE n=1 Tax=Acidithrix ferrooxidans TaxID=1280514 RepID=A0A0D8HET5_9ACTN|nr:response regulator transcription factor [Acidithrix ferrooxidans]KJF16374.1 KDP operon transcriptional regulatory protein KdpE [Acidithrix ferrooxidans]